MQQRYYDPIAMRFLSVDPVHVDTSSGGNFNRYWYANNSPYTYSDPDGEFANLIAAAVGAGVGLIVGVGAESYRQMRAGEFNGRALLVEGGKGAVVGGALGLTGGAAAAGGLGLGAQAATTGVVGTGIGAGAHSLGEVAKGNPAPSATESVAAGLATGAGGLAGTAVSPYTTRLTTSVVPGVASHPVTSYRGRVFNTVNIPPRTYESPATAAAANSVAESAVEVGAKNLTEQR
jgi:hypothetical protein